MLKLFACRQKSCVIVTDYSCFSIKTTSSAELPRTSWTLKSWYFTAARAKRCTEPRRDSPPVPAALAQREERTGRERIHRQQQKMAKRTRQKIQVHLHGNLCIVEKTWELFPVYSVICKFCKLNVRSWLLCFRHVLNLLKLVLDVSWSHSFTKWFLILI